MTFSHHHYQLKHQSEPRPTILIPQTNYGIWEDKYALRNAVRSSSLGRSSQRAALSNGSALITGLMDGRDQRRDSLLQFSISAEVSHMFWKKSGLSKWQTNKPLRTEWWANEKQRQGSMEMTAMTDHENTFSTSKHTNAGQQEHSK